MAALAEVVVVVECHQAGGSLYTVRAATRRGVAVGAVPGSVRSPASAGTNDLLADGCFVVRDASDVLVALSLARASIVPVRPRRRAAGAGDPTEPAGTAGPARAANAASPAAPLGPLDLAGPDGAARPADPADRDVLEALEWDASSLEQLLRRTGLPLAALSASLERLRGAGRARGEGGWWARV
jgi:predicted Rossmann fold nucleotide-binding protein DprA/Smf involved in DNA uptake